MDSKLAIQEQIQTRLGHFLENTIIVCDITLFDISKINEGVLTVWAGWSPHGLINCLRTIQYLYDGNRQEYIYVIDIDDIIDAEKQIKLFGHVLHGWGEIFIIKEGVITDEFLGKGNFSSFKTRYEFI